ncbi:MAG: hypothetical protein ACWA6R_07210 [Nitrosomonas sp.]
MKNFIARLALFFLTACAGQFPLTEPTGNLQTHEENLPADHAVLARCALTSLQSDARPFMRVLQFRVRTNPIIPITEIHAFDLRYLPNVYATNSPTNPDAVVVPIDTNPEALPYTPRNKKGEPVYAFALTLEQIDATTVRASLKGDPYLARSVWDMLSKCTLTPSSSLHSQTNVS